MRLYIQGLRLYKAWCNQGIKMNLHIINNNSSNCRSMYFNRRKKCFIGNNLMRMYLREI